MKRTGCAHSADISEQLKDSPVILINPQTSLLEFADPEESRELTPTPPLGILYIASALEHAGFSVKFYDLAVMPEKRDDLLAYVENVEAPVVGMTVSTLAHNNAVRLAGAIKEKNPQSTVIMGGPHVTFRAEEVLSSGVVNYVVRREGEHTIVELLKAHHADVKRIQGISYCHGGEYISTPDRPFIEDLDSIPFPARDLAPMDLYMHPGIIITGRGCPYRCQFCVAGPLSGHRYRVRTPENVIEEVKEIYSTYSITDFFFADDTFTAIQERTRAICNLLEQLDFPITWICESRVTAVTPELLEEMAHAGCTKIQFGVESGSDSILKSINKGITTDRVREAVSWALGTGMDVACSFIIGHPEDTPVTIDRTLNFARELREMAKRGRVKTEFGIATPLPGTKLCEEAESLGITVLNKDYDRYDLANPVINTRYLTANDLRSLLFNSVIEQQSL
jgi:anaerobic magnesium-protoporphyrin IX monomethyl ester cyclase